jgi:hypothetical protein
MKIISLKDITGTSRFGKSLYSEYVEAVEAASREADPSHARGLLFPSSPGEFKETVAATDAYVKKIFEDFDFNSNGKIDGRSEKEEFDRHIDLCMKEYGSNE